jgi:hypothetical protein
MSPRKEAMMKKSWALVAALCLIPIAGVAEQPDGTVGGAAEPQVCVELCGCIDESNLENFLRTAEVVSIEDIGVGITKPQRITLRKDGHQCRAIFKTVDISDVEPGYTNRLESVFTDKYTYEEAAYRVDRMLGIGLVPVTVTREIDGRRGSVQLWIENAIEMQTAADKNMTIGNMDLLLQRLMLMYILDAMIYNVDRNFTNVLVRPESDDLFLIDHSRAFRIIKKLPDLKEERPIPVPASVARELRTLDVETLESQLGNLLSKRQIRAIDSRRKLLVSELEARGLLPAVG